MLILVLIFQLSYRFEVFQNKWLEKQERAEELNWKSESIDKHICGISL